MTNRLKVMEMEEALNSWKEKSADQLKTYRLRGFPFFP
jgi:hypothetical protein